MFIVQNENQAKNSIVKVFFSVISYAVEIERERERERQRQRQREKKGGWEGGGGVGYVHAKFRERNNCKCCAKIFMLFFTLKSKAI